MKSKFSSMALKEQTMLHQINLIYKSHFNNNFSSIPVPSRGKPGMWGVGGPRILGILIDE